jgi:hypothetical protein
MVIMTRILEAPRSFLGGCAVRETNLECTKDIGRIGYKTGLEGAKGAGVSRNPCF